MSMTFAILFAILLVFAVYIGFLAGQGICNRFVVTTRGYWLANLAGVLVSVVATALVFMLPMLYAVTFGGLAGYIAGLKMSFGESAGPWKWLDRFMNVNRSHRRVAEAGTGEARRRRRKQGEAGPDLISVDERGGASGGAGASSAAVGTAPNASTATSTNKKRAR